MSGEQTRRKKTREREVCNRKKSKNKRTPFFKIIMKKYKQFYKYSYCVINHLHLVQHTSWTFFFFLITHVATMYPVMCFIKWKIFFFTFLFCTRKQKCFPFGQLTVDEVTLTHTPAQTNTLVHTQCTTSGKSRLQKWNASTVREGHNHDWVTSMKSEPKLH